MSAHEIYVHSRVLETMPKSGAARKRLMEFIHGLRERPDTVGDYTDKDSTLRERQIKIVGEYAVVYWVDAAVKIVMVAEVRPADR